MSKYEDLWKWIGGNGEESFRLSFDDMERISGFPIDHSFLNAKKELKEYGFTVEKISMKERTVSFRRTEPSGESGGESILLRPYRRGDENGMAALVARTLRVSSKDDYPADYIEDAVREHCPEFFLEHEKDAHFYVLCDGDRLVGCGGITGYWGSSTESYLLTIFVLPEYQRKGLGRRIIAALEDDEYFRRAWRTEVGSSLTAVDFYRKLGYVCKNGVTTPDEYGVVRLEKKRERLMTEGDRA